MSDRKKTETASWNAGEVRRAAERKQVAKKKTKKSRLGWLWYILGVLASSALLAGVAWLMINDVCALNKKPLDAVVEVERGDSIGVVTDKLKDAGLIESKLLFRVFAVIFDADEIISAGTYELSTDMDFRCLIHSMHSSLSVVPPNVVTVTIPEGIGEGQRVVLRGQGSAGRNGGANGDLVIEVHIRPHAFFEREGNHIYCEIPISFTEAALGADIEIPTLEGKQSYHIPDGTQPGTAFTLRGKGVPDLHSKRRGDLIITVNVEVPKNLSNEQKKLLQDFAKASGKDASEKRTGFLKKLFDRK